MRILMVILVVGLLGFSPTVFAQSFIFPTRTSTAPLDLNTAPAKALQRLPGIGPKKAAQIVRYRTKRPFRRVRDLMKLRGIGPKTLKRLRPLLTVSLPKAAQPPRRLKRRKRSSTRRKR